MDVHQSFCRGLDCVDNIAQHREVFFDRFFLRRRVGRPRAIDDVRDLRERTELGAARGRIIEIDSDH